MHVLIRVIGPRLRREVGQGLVEMLISLTILAIGIAAVLALITSGELTLQRSDQKGTAATLADDQLEAYRALPYVDIRLDAAELPSSGVYVTAHVGDSSIPAATACTSDGTVTGTPAGCLVVGGYSVYSSGTYIGEAACPGGSSDPPACLPVQTVTGPDHRTYEVDTYITYVTPSSGATLGRQTKQVLVIVRDPNVAGSPILARNSSTFDLSTCAYDPATATTLPCGS